MIGKNGRPSSFASGCSVPEHRRLVVGADDRDRDDRHAVAQRLLDEAEVERLQHVALGRALLIPAMPSGKTSTSCFARKQLAHVVARADHLADARVEDVHERQRAGPAVDHRAHQARRLRGEDLVADDHRRVEREQPAVVRGQDRPFLLGNRARGPSSSTRNQYL